MHLNQKLSILFWLWNKKIDRVGKSPIYVRITIDGQRAQCSLDLKIRSDLVQSCGGKGERQRTGSRQN